MKNKFLPPIWTSDSPLTSFMSGWCMCMAATEMCCSDLSLRENFSWGMLLWQVPLQSASALKPIKQCPGSLSHHWAHHGQVPIMSPLSAPKYSTQSSLLFLSCRVSDLYHCLKPFCPLSLSLVLPSTDFLDSQLCLRYLLSGVPNQPTVQKYPVSSEVYLLFITGELSHLHFSFFSLIKDNFLKTTFFLSFFSLVKDNLGFPR